MSRRRSFGGRPAVLSAVDFNLLRLKYGMHTACRPFAAWAEQIGMMLVCCNWARFWASPPKSTVTLR